MLSNNYCLDFEQSNLDIYYYKPDKNEMILKITLSCTLAGRDFSTSFLTRRNRNGWSILWRLENPVFSELTWCFSNSSQSENLVKKSIFKEFRVASTASYFTLIDKCSVQQYMQWLGGLIEFPVILFVNLKRYRFKATYNKQNISF